MPVNYKINIALFICTAFIFKLLFVNISFISSSNISQNNTSVKEYFSTIVKKTTSAEIANNTKTSEYPVLEICEENSDDDDQFKSNPFFAIQLFYSLIIHKTKDSLEKITPFYNHLSYTSSHRYLAFRVFRL